MTDTIFTDALLASLAESTRPVATATPSRPRCTRRTSSCVRVRRAVRPRVVVRRAGVAHPEPGDWFTVTIADEPLIVVRDKDGTVNCLSAVCQHRGMQVCDGAGQLGTRSSARTTTGTTPRRPPAGSAGDGAHGGLRQEGQPAAAAARSNCGRGSCSSTWTPTPAPLAPTLASVRAVPRELRPRPRGVPRHVHADRPAVELEGDVRELQRRLPRQPAAPVRPGLLPEQHEPRSPPSGRPTPTSSSAPPATPTSTAASTPPTARSCRCSPG